MTAKDRKTNENKRTSKAQKFKKVRAPSDRKAFEQISMNESLHGSRLSEKHANLKSVLNQSTLRSGLSDTPLR